MERAAMTPLTRHQVLLYKGDFHELAEFYTSKSTTEVIRELVRAHIIQCRQRLAEIKEKERV